MKAPIWDGRSVLMCVGTGGVGKTTASAAIAVAAAASGLRTLVMTIDPARRLANAMGLERVGNVEREIPPELIAPFGVVLRAPLFVMMPNTKRIFDELVERVAPNEERRQKILHNRFYQQFSTALAGSLEYAAVEKLYEVHASGRYDLIVLDTPPSQNAIDFLEAPGRILDFLDHESLQLLLKPYALAGRFTLKLLDVGSSFILRTLGRLAGTETIRELAEFVWAFQGMYDGFRQRSRRVAALLTSRELSFVLVTTIQPHQVKAMLRLRSDLHREGMGVGTVVVNRLRQAPLLPGGGGEAAAVARLDALLRDLGAEDRSTVLGAFREEVTLAEIGREAVGELSRRLSSTPILELSELPLDAHDLESLARLCQAFLPAPPLAQGEASPPGSGVDSVSGEGR